ncbi:hypothetical protein DKP78_17775, partial [Enterococcus faecium]
QKGIVHEGKMIYDYAITISIHLKHLNGQNGWSYIKLLSALFFFFNICPMFMWENVDKMLLGLFLCFHQVITTYYSMPSHQEGACHKFKLNLTLQKLP